FKDLSQLFASTTCVLRRLLADQLTSAAASPVAAEKAIILLSTTKKGQMIIIIKKCATEAQHNTKQNTALQATTHKFVLLYHLYIIISPLIATSAFYLNVGVAMKDVDIAENFILITCYMAGKVRDVRLIMDRNSRRSKGVGYIEFYDAMSVPMAIALSGQLLLGQQVMVKPSEAEKNLVQSNASSGAASGGARKLYVGNLHSNINEDQLRQVFEPFGQVELVQLPLDPLSGLCKGFGFVQFARLEDAKAAQSLNGQLEIAGRVIKVSAVTDQAGMQVSGATGDLDDEEAGGLALNASSRALLMQKLDRSGITTSLTGGTGIAGLTTPVAIPTVSVLGAAPAAAPLLHPTVPGLAIPGATLPITTPSIDLAPPSQCLLLKNMFDPALETDPDFDLDIRDDVQEECSKFGQLKHIFVDKSTAGFVYLRFDSITAAMSAQKALHGRWFAGKMITATFM
ncbi:hypothetical protein ACJX0J_038943, partial [Zea mays]